LRWAVSHKKFRHHPIQWCMYCMLLITKRGSNNLRRFEVVKTCICPIFNRIKVINLPSKGAKTYSKLSLLLPHAVKIEILPKGFSTLAISLKHFSTFTMCSITSTQTILLRDTAFNTSAPHQQQ